VREERGRGGEVHTQVLEQFQMINCSRRVFSLYLLFNTLTHFSPGAPDITLVRDMSRYAGGIPIFSTND